VCAAVSALLLTLQAALETWPPEDCRIETSLEPGAAELHAHPATPGVAAELATQYETIVTGLRLLSDAFPGEIKTSITI